MRSEYTELINDTMRELESIRSWINEGKNKFDSKTRYLISYSVIRASGSVEVIYKGTIFDYLTEDAKNQTKVYLEKNILDSSSNPSTGNMSNMLQNISSDWKQEFDIQTKNSGCKDKLNSLVQLRNDFVHGDNITASIDTVIMYFNSAIEILKILELTMQQ